MWNCSAASVWLPLQRSSFSMMMRRSMSSRMSKSEALGLCCEQGVLEAAAGDVAGEQVGADDRPRGEHDAALDGVFQFADVAGPLVIDQGAQGVGGELARGEAVLVGVELEEVLGQQGNVFAAGAQRGQVHGDDVEAVEEVFAEAAFADRLAQIDVGGGDDAHVHLNLLHAAQMHEAAVLQDAQDLGLGVHAHGGDLVHEERAAVGDFKEAFLGGDGRGECALDVAEERGFQQLARAWRRC